MGTRADFWSQRADADGWLGSVAWDGYPDGLPPEVTGAVTEYEFRAAVAKMLAGREDGTTPERGWPWPWDDSCTTDFAYVWEDARVKVYGFGEEFVEDDESDRPKVPFPNMAERKNFTMGKRSGLIVVQAGRIVDGPPDA